MGKGKGHRSSGKTEEDDKTSRRNECSEQQREVQVSSAMLSYKHKLQRRWRSHLIYIMKLRLETATRHGLPRQLVQQCNHNIAQSA